MADIRIADASLTATPTVNTKMPASDGSNTAVTISAGQVIALHTAESDPHPQYAAALTSDENYVTDAEKAALHPAVTVSDSSSIDLTLTGQALSAAAIFGTTSGTVCQGNDSRLSDARTPTSHNNTAHSETYITAAGVTYENLSANGDIGTGASQVAQGNHTHSEYQATLVSGTNIKTINSQSILGSGDLVVSTGTTDHGLLSGLGDDDHTQYLNETRHDLLDHAGLTGVPTQYTDEMAQDAVGAAIAAGTQTGITVQYDDANNKFNFTVTAAGAGDVTGPASSTDGNIVLFDGITGKVIKNSTYSPASFAPALGTDDNYVTDAEKAALHPAVTVSDSTSIDLTLTGQALSASAIFGTAAGTVCQGNDVRLSDARTPLSHGNEVHSTAFEATSNKGQANGYVPLDGSIKIAETYLPDSIVGQVEYQGTWNATTNTPTIPAAATANKGHYYIVSVSGTTNIDGIAEWTIGDWIISNGTTWNKVDNTDSVSSVFGRAGAIVANSGDYTADQITETATRVFVSPTQKSRIDELEATDSPTFADITLTGLTGNVIGNSASVETSIEALDDSQTHEENSGFEAWTSGSDASTYTITGGAFQLDRDGYGYIRGTKVTWSSPQTTGVLSANECYYVYIDTDGILKTSTSYVSGKIMLFEVLFDGVNYIVVRENHPYEFQSALSGYLHRNVGNVIAGLGANIGVVTVGTGTVATDRQLKIVGADVYEDHGLRVTIPDSGGAGVTWLVCYKNTSGKWARYATQAELPMYWNSVGTPQALTTGPNGDVGVYTLYVTKDDIESSAPKYIAVMNNAAYNTTALAEAAITSGTVQKADNELAMLELAQLGYALVENNASGGYIASTIVAKSSFAKQIVGGGAATSNHALLSNLDYASSGHTGFQAASANLTSIAALSTTQITTLSSANLKTISDLTTTQVQSLGTSGIAALTTTQIAALSNTGATGTGKLVFDTSPTLVTPALGTPASGTLTNCTGLPNTGVTGLGTMSTQAANNVAITGGTINNTPTGGSTPAAGAFTTLSASDLSVAGVTKYTGYPVGVVGSDVWCGPSGDGGFFANAPTGESVYLGIANNAIATISSTGLSVTGGVTASVHNTYDLGTTSVRWKDLWLQSGAFNGSDARLKTSIQPFSPAEIQAAKELSKEIGLYQWLDSIEKKGADAARLHTGLTVQRAIEIMEANGLDWTRYGFIGYDQWDDVVVEHPAVEAVEAKEAVLDDDGNVIEPAVEAVEYKAAWTETTLAAGEAYSFRYDQLNLFIARGVEARLSALEAANG